MTHVEVWLPVITENAGGFSKLTLLLGPFNIIMGPGWYRSIFGSQYFMFYTNVGNVACAAASSTPREICVLP